MAEVPPVLMIGGGGERRTLGVGRGHADWWIATTTRRTSMRGSWLFCASGVLAIVADADQIVPSCYMGVTVSQTGAAGARRSMGHRGEVQ